MRLTDAQVRDLLDRVHHRLRTEHPKADVDELLSDAGMGIALAQDEWTGPFELELFFSVAYRRAIDAYRDLHPQVDRRRMNPQPKERDRMLDTTPTDPHELTEQPDARQEPDDLEPLLSLCKNEHDAEFLRGRAAGRSVRQMARPGKTYQRINWQCQRGIDDILIALGQEPRYGVRQKSSDYRRLVPVVMEEV